MRCVEHGCERVQSRDGQRPLTTAHSPHTVKPYRKSRKASRDVIFTLFTLELRKIYTALCFLTVHRLPMRLPVASYKMWVGSWQRRRRLLSR